MSAVDGLARALTYSCFITFHGLIGMLVSLMYESKLIAGFAAAGTCFVVQMAIGFVVHGPLEGNE